ncbi:hypothetical protein CAEBREN_18903 [Caenorhabditis brenneri]|uniref:F-box domain-containing protein n=1 Tax=Caenorhabditis brenneri TaxID=135651 RepID=G0M791_CAEBE|nr:hypothetical protein CAEBREN_18903 [Caenorhabditis brenneri]
MPTLTDVPDRAMGVILKELKYRTVMKLRKVCTSLRDQVDNIKPSTNFKSICIKLENGGASVTLAEDFFRTRIITFKPDPEGCRVENGTRIILLKKLTAHEALFNDIKHVLTFQTEKMWFLWVYSSENEETNDAVFQRVGSIFALRSALLKVENLYMEATNQDQILQIVPFLDPTVFVTFTLLDLSKAKHTIQINAVANLAQWLACKTLVIKNCIISGKVQNFFNFGSISVIFQTITSRNLVSIKKAFFESSVPHHFEIGYINFTDEERFFQLPEFIREGREKKKLRWFFRMSRRGLILHISIKKEKKRSYFEFSTIMEARVPRYAPIFG